LSQSVTSPATIIVALRQTSLINSYFGVSEIPMTTAPESRDLGVQPIAELMEQLELKPHDLVEVSPRQITHKMVSRAMKGRWLTKNTRRIVLQAFCSATGKTWRMQDLFNYDNPPC
jgi:hypothetical protein